MICAFFWVYVIDYFNDYNNETMYNCLASYENCLKIIIPVNINFSIISFHFLDLLEYTEIAQKFKGRIFNCFFVVTRFHFFHFFQLKNMNIKIIIILPPNNCFIILIFIDIQGNYYNAPNYIINFFFDQYFIQFNEKLH